MTSSDAPAAAWHPDEQQLTSLFLGEGDDAHGVAVARHVGECATCAELLDAVRATADLVRGAAAERFTSPPSTVWEAVLHEVEGSVASATDPSTDAVLLTRDADAGGGDPGGAVIGMGDAGRGAAWRRGRVATWVAFAGAAAALVIGVGVGPLVTERGESPSPGLEVVGDARLASLDEPAAPRGSAQVHRQEDRAVLSVSASDLGGPDGTREVWLLNTDGARMVSLGLLAAGEEGEFDFPERLLADGYRIVDISYEPDDGNPAHSGTSLARGTIEG